VLCGMCLPYCPTYRVYQNEAESPRGRIVLMQALSKTGFQADQRLFSHLDHCVGCRACETMCPSRVPFSRLINSARQLSRQQHPLPAQINQLLKTVLKPDGLNRYQGWLGNKVIQSISGAGLKLLGQDSTQRLLAQASPQRLHTLYPAGTAPRGSVALFTGCMGKLFDINSLLNSIRLLNHYGFNVHVPVKQYCCGALHENNGYPTEAETLIHNNQQVFGDIDIDYILFSANGCGAQLAEHAFSVPVMDIASFLLQQTDISPDDFQALDSTVVIHQSCSSTNKLKITGISQQLAQKIPGIQLLTLHHADVCCGAGGSHLLSQGETADKIINLKIEELKQLKPDYILSDNTGCSMHFRGSLERAGLDIAVVHPVELLARQLK